MRERPDITLWLFLLVGLGLLAGAMWWTYAGVYQPMGWPRTTGEVISSRVINPSSPSQYQGELVFRYDAAGSARELTVVHSWSSSSYDMVRRFVDGYPAGRRLPLGVNPANPDDVAYELDWTFGAMVGPLALGLLGAIFAGIGVFVARLSRPRAGPPSLSLNPLRLISPAFLSIGLVILVIGVLMFRSDAAMRSSWGTIRADVVSAEVVTGSMNGTTGRTRNNPGYNVRVRFRYSLNGRSFENATTYGFSTSSEEFVRNLTTLFAPGSQHDIRYRPDDPNIIRFDLDSWWSTFGLSVGMIGMGTMFLAFGLMARRLVGSTRRRLLRAGL